MDIVEFDSRDKMIIAQIRARFIELTPEDCYTCLKCTSGCPATKLYPKFAPHKFMVASIFGLVDDILESGILWYCFHCIKCETRCPMKTAPSQTICSLANIAISRGIAPPKAFTGMIRAIKEKGAIAQPREVPTTDFDFLTRDDLGLPSRGIKDIEKFQKALKIIGADEVLEIKPKEDEK